MLAIVIGLAAQIDDAEMHACHGNAINAASQRFLNVTTTRLSIMVAFVYGYLAVIIRSRLSSSEKTVYNHNKQLIQSVLIIATIHLTTWTLSSILVGVFFSPTAVHGGGTQNKVKSGLVNMSIQSLSKIAGDHHFGFGNSSSIEGNSDNHDYPADIAVSMLVVTLSGISLASNGIVYLCRSEAYQAVVKSALKRCGCGVQTRVAPAAAPSAVVSVRPGAGQGLSTSKF